MFQAAIEDGTWNTGDPESPFDSKCHCVSLFAKRLFGEEWDIVAGAVFRDRIPRVPRFHDSRDGLIGHYWLTGEGETVFLDITADQFGYAPVLFGDMDTFTKDHAYLPLQIAEIDEYLDIVTGWEAMPDYEKLRAKVIALLAERASGLKL